MKCAPPSRKQKYLFTLLSVAAPCHAVFAGVVTGPGQSAEVGPGSPVESWTVSNQAVLNVIQGGSTRQISAASGAYVHIAGGSVTASTNPSLGQGAAVRLSGGSGLGATALIERSQITDTTGRAMSLIYVDAADVPQASAVVNASQVTGARDGAFINSGGVLRFDEATNLTGTGGSGAVVSSGHLEVAGGSVVHGGTNGIRIVDGTRSPGEDMGRAVVVDGASVSGGAGPGILVEQGTVQATVATISLLNGATVTGGNGIAVQATAGTETTLAIDDSAIVGDMASAGGRFDIGMDNGASVAGRMLGVAALALDKASTWSVSGNSDVGSLSLTGSTVAFQPRTDGAYSTALVRGDFSGSGGVLQFNTMLDAGGALSAQGTDRLLIQGDVTTTGTTEIVVTPKGAGANTDGNGNGIADAAEGISLVQVGGGSRADAFALRGGYVAAGPWQYTLHAFGPGQTDPAQNALPSGELNWDYRLGSRYVCDGDCDPLDPQDPDPGRPDDPDEPDEPDLPDEPGLPDPERPGRVAVVPQLPSYLSAPAALLTYGDMMTDGLRQRLGDIRQGSSHDPVGGEVFARYLGGQLRYQSNIAFRKYGYDFDQQVNALQLGGSLIALDGDNGTLRAGWAMDHGTTRVTPKAADGNSSAKYRANGVSGWITWQHGSGFWMDGVIGATRYRGDVGTDLRGSDVGRVRANGWVMSLEAGMPIALGNEWVVEPRFQLKHQSLDFRDFRDADGLDVRLGTAKQTSARLGGRLAWAAKPAFMPYVSLDLTHTSNGDPGVNVASEAWGIADRFGSGRVGNAYRVGAGATSQLGQHVQIYGEGTYQHFVGSYGMRGWAGNVGIRVTF
jgi:outer membrane autotransporter protein